MPVVCCCLRFKEEVAVLERMIGLADIVRHAGLPTFICLQVGAAMHACMVADPVPVYAVW